MNKEITNIEKNLFSHLHSEFDKLLYNLNKPNKNNKNLTISQITMISDVNKDLLNLTNSIEKINNSLLKNKNQNEQLTIKQIEKLEDFDKDNKTIKTFLPFIMYYRMMLDTI